MSILRSIAFIAVAAVLVAGCGKDKQEETTPEVAEAPAEVEPAPLAEQEPPPEPEPVDAAAELEEIVYFEFDSSSLDDGAREKLEQNAAWLQEDPDRMLTIEGHTDQKGTTEYNVALGDRRAQAAKEYMVRLGIDPSRIKVISFGEERPASKNASKNRRGVFVATRK